MANLTNSQEPEPEPEPLEKKNQELEPEPLGKKNQEPEPEKKFAGSPALSTMFDDHLYALNLYAFNISNHDNKHFNGAISVPDYFCIPDTKFNKNRENISFLIRIKNLFTTSLIIGSEINKSGNFPRIRISIRYKSATLEQSSICHEEMQPFLRL